MGKHTGKEVLNQLNKISMAGKVHYEGQDEEVWTFAHSAGNMTVNKETYEVHAKTYGQPNWVYLYNLFK